MKLRLGRFLGFLILAAVLAEPFMAGQQVDLLSATAAFGAPAPSGTPTATGTNPGDEARARAVPRVAEERDRQRATQTSRGPHPGAPSLSVSTQATGAPVYSSKFGFAVADVSTGSGSTLEKVPQAKAGWVMGWVSWRNVEPSPGTYAWTLGGGNDLDNVVNAGTHYGLKVLVHVFDPPTWATSDGSGHLSKVNPSDLQSAMQAMAKHVAGRAMAYEMFNEPNLNYEWGQDVDATGAAGYAKLLKAAYAGVKAGDSAAVVISAGLADGACCGSMDDLDYLRAFYAAGAKGYFDALGTHPYGGNYAPEQDPTCGGTCFRRAELQRQIMLDNGDSITPMWGTEVGWLLDSSYDLGSSFNWQKVSAQQQADYEVRAFQYAQANWSWMGPMFVFNLDHDTAMWCGGPCYPPTTSVYWFSVLNPDRSPRLAYTELSTMVTGTAPPAATPTASSTATTGLTPTPTATATSTPTPTVATGAPGAPSGLTATAVTSTQINLAWSDNSGNEDGFAIERSTDGVTFVEIYRALANVRSYPDGNLQPNKWYYYRVRAYKGTAYSAYSNTARAKTLRR